MRRHGGPSSRIFSKGICGGFMFPHGSASHRSSFRFKLGSYMRNLVCGFLVIAACAMAQTKMTPEKEAALKADLTGDINSMAKRAQVMVDSVFSFGELGFQEFETSKYLTGILEKEGFKIERGIAGIPTSWVASWGSGKPVISLGSD